MAVSDLKERANQEAGKDGRPVETQSTSNPGSTVEEKAETDRLTNNDDTIGEGFKNPGKKRFRFTLKQKVASGLAAGMVIGGGFGVLTVVSMPFQFIQLAQSLQKFHFTNAEDAADDRMTRLARYVRYRNTPAKMRLGVMGNLMADRFETRLKNNGFELSYTEKRQWFDGLVIDPEKVPADSEIGRAMNRNVPNAQEEVLKVLSDDLKIPRSNIDLDTGKIIINKKGLSFLQKRRLVKVVLKNSGYSGTVSAVGTRVMGKRLKIDWHPIKKIDDALLGKADERLAKWKENREARKGGEIETKKGSISTDEVDGETRADPDAVEAGNNLDELEGVKAEAKNEGSTGKLKEYVGGKFARGVGGLSAAIGILCTIKAIADSIDDVKHANVVEPMARMGMEAITMGNQVMSGKNIDLEQLGFMSKVLYDEQNKSSWASARSIQAEQGEEQTGPDIPDEAQVNTENNLVSRVLGEIPGLGTVCKAANSVIGQVVSIGIDFLGGPVSAAVGTSVSYIFGPKIIGGIVNWLSGNPISIDFAGADYGNIVNYGARLAANETNISRGGTELSPSQSLALKIENNKAEHDDNKHKSFAQRYFDYKDTGSMLSTMINRYETKNLDVFASFANIPKSFTKNIARLPLLASGRAVAAAGYDYGFPEFGFSVEDLQSDDIANPYQNAEEVDKILRGGNGETYKKRATNCFGVSFDSDNNVTYGGASTNYAKLGADCRDSSLEWRRIRFYIFDNQIMSSAVCLDGADVNECTKLGFGSGSSAGSSASVAPPTGLTSHPTLGQPNANGYYLLPDAPNGEYQWNGGTPPESRYGSKALVDAIYTVAIRWYQKYPENKLIIGDLNALTGHKSHKKGVDVDITSVGSAAANTSGDAEKSKELGRMFADTGIIKFIFYNDDAVQLDFNSYVSEKNLEGVMQYEDNHANHFHVRILDQYVLTENGQP